MRCDLGKRPSPATVALVLTCSILNGCGSQAEPNRAVTPLATTRQQAPTLPKAKQLPIANAYCRIEDPRIRRAEAALPNFNFSYGAVVAIQREVDGLRQTFDGSGRTLLVHALTRVNRSLQAFKSADEGPAALNADLLSAQTTARRFGLRCSFGARAARFFR